MNCKYYERDEKLDKIEENLLNYLKDVSNFTVGFWHSKKELRRSARAVANNGLDQIAGATSRNDMVAIRQYLKETVTSYFKLSFGDDFVEFVEDEVHTLVKLMGKQSYEEFTLKSSNIVIISTFENEILVEGSKLNLIKH